MKHIKEIRVAGIREEILIKLTGRYFTQEYLARIAIKKLLGRLKNSTINKGVLTIADPFGGDGRLVNWFIEEWHKLKLPPVKWNIHIWDINKFGLLDAEKHFNSLRNKDIQLSVIETDSFTYSKGFINFFDFVITNPPWELLKPDSRELKSLQLDEKKKYKEALKIYDKMLKDIYPDSQPDKKFAGWGTNLSRVGLDVTYNILKERGTALIILPATFFSDCQSKSLRKKIFENTQITDIAFYPAEAKLFGKADVNVSTLSFTKMKKSKDFFVVDKYDKNLNLCHTNKLMFDQIVDNEGNYNIPFNGSVEGIKVLNKMKDNFQQWGFIEQKQIDGLWAGREIDETRIYEFLSHNEGGYIFIKGKMIERFKMKEEPKQYFSKTLTKVPDSINYERIVWRDVSRTNQKRRIIATIIPSKFIVGNSLGVCYYTDADKSALRILLGIMNSLCFEFQLRSYLATGHVSLSAIRKVCIPDRSLFTKYFYINTIVEKLLNGDTKYESILEAFVAKYVYKLKKDEFNIVIESFEKLSVYEKVNLQNEYDKLVMTESTKTHNIGNINIPNHLTANLSDLDRLIIHSVPPGGNWKNIPSDIPSKRIEQIRESFKAGKGSRSTYYGRLFPSKPSYTINTYFNRPGNGCHIHYEQDRILSQREAARLQTFPDNFIFVGSQSSVNTQIGNAVPPLLAFQIAQQIKNVLKKTGQFIDLFSGAGGLGLGFKWAKWKPIFANDIDRCFLETYARNIHNITIEGSITDENVFNKIIELALTNKKENPNIPLWVLGGPPCQGFSTAGNKRSMEDQRNHLFKYYVKFLEIVKPDGFVFENVAGLLSMEKGKIYNDVKTEFENIIPRVKGVVIDTENYAIPQRRKRVFLIGQKNKNSKDIELPKRLTSLYEKKDLFSKYLPCVSVEDAISDLPDLIPGQNGSSLEYKHKPKNPYQSFMRGFMTPEEYLSNFEE